MKLLSRFTTQDLMLIAIIAALSLAIKPLITPIIHLVSAPLLIPGGALAGGFYMLWFGIIVVLVPRKGSAILLAICQGVVTIILGQFGNHGILSIVSYTLPGIVAELVAVCFKDKRQLIAQILIVGGANLTGTFFVALVIMRLPSLPLLISLVASLISGTVGGIISFTIIKQLHHYGFQLVNEHKQG